MNSRLLCTTLSGDLHAVIYTSKREKLSNVSSLRNRNECCKIKNKKYSLLHTWLWFSILFITLLYLVRYQWTSITRAHCLSRCPRERTSRTYRLEGLPGIEDLHSNLWYEKIGIGIELERETWLRSFSFGFFYIYYMLKIHRVTKCYYMIYRSSPATANW